MSVPRRDDIATKDAILTSGASYGATIGEMAERLIANAGHEVTFRGLCKTSGLKEARAVMNYVDPPASLAFVFEEFSMMLRG
ncbi:MAG: hypothetical protein QXW06_02965, partial [Thermoplasmata archaeon]